MNPVAETRFVLQRELRKSFRSIKGIILSVLTVVGGGGLAMLMAQSDQVRQERFNERAITPEALLEVKRQLLSWWFMDAATGEHVAHAPGLIFFLFAVSLVMLPAVVLILGFDTVSAEQQHKTVRYWTVRTRRSSYIVGKWLGLWATCGVVALGMHMLIWIVCTVRGEGSFAEIVGWGFRFWLASMPILGIWCAVSVFVSSLMRIPVLALLLTAALFFFWWLVYFISWASHHPLPKGNEEITVPATTPLLYIFPNFYDRFILSPQLGAFLTGLFVCFGFAAMLLAGASALFARRDV